jgi:predicted PurR-regulated permease PerM
MNDRLIRQRGFFFGMVLILAVLALILVWQFIQSILLALALVVILKPMYNWFLGRKWIKGSSRTATGMTLVVFILVIAIPAILIVGGAISQAAYLFSDLTLEGLEFSLRGINTWMEGAIKALLAQNFQIENIHLVQGISQVVAQISIWLKTMLISLGRSLPGFFTNGFIVLVLMFVLLPRYRGLGKKDILDIVPFPPQITELFLDKMDLMIKAMFKGTFIIAIAQGLAMGLVLWVAGVPYTMFLTLLSMFLSLVPLIGISLVAWPVGILLIVSGNVWQGVFVIVAFLLVVASIDNILRPYLIPKGAQLNPALVILSVIGGLRVMGIIGALYGPVVMILLVTSIDVYTKYLLRSDLETLEREGRIDLKELGLVQQDDRQDQNIGEMFYTVLKNVTKPFRRGTAEATVANQVGTDGTKDIRQAE